MKYKRKRKLVSAGKYGITIFVVVVTALPFVWMVSTAFKPRPEQFTAPPTLLPVHPTLDNFLDMESLGFTSYFLNSVITSGLTTVLVIVVSIFSAYSLARLKILGSKQIMYVILFTQMIPLQALAVPLYIIMKSLNFLDTYQSLIISYLTFTVPTALWLLWSFTSIIPDEIEEAAMMDGARTLMRFRRVILPLMRVGIASTASYVFIASWQQFFFPLVFITSNSHKPLTVGLLSSIGQFAIINWGDLMAMSTVFSLPIFILFLYLQKHLVSGFLRGALKG